LQPARHPALPELLAFVFTPSRFPPMRTISEPGKSPSPALRLGPIRPPACPIRPNRSLIPERSSKPPQKQASTITFIPWRSG